MMRISMWPGGPTLGLADHWQPMRTLPDDPSDMQVFGFQLRDGASGFLMMHTIPPDEAMPVDQQAVIDGRLGKGLSGLSEVGGSVHSNEQGFGAYTRMPQVQAGLLEQTL